MLSIDNNFFNPFEAMRFNPFEVKTLGNTRSWETSTRDQNWDVSVKVTRTWDIIDPTTDELMSLDVVLMDVQVYAIHI